MNAAKLQTLLRQRFPVENERHEWKGWTSLKHNISGRKGEDLICYVSALANMEGGCIVIGAQDGTLLPNGIADTADYTPENLPHRLLGRCVNLPSLGVHVEVLRAEDTGAAVWVVHVPRHSPRRPVAAHDTAWQRDHDKLVPLREDRLAAILAEPLAGADWSAEVVTGAMIADLDPEALALARRQYRNKHAQDRWAPDVPGWSDVEFLDRAHLAQNGRITRACLLLLGRAESAAMLAPHPVELTWKRPAERQARHFGPPFLTATTRLMQCIGNPIIKLFPETQLIPVQLPRYEAQLVLEALHNCIAHQDYERAERVVVEEWPDRLRLLNAGEFVDGKPAEYYEGTRTPTRYRNPWLAAAMNEVGMIDKAGFGISEMVQIQRRRYLPLPDYQGSTSLQTVFNVMGTTLSLNYSRLLMERTDIDLATVLLLDTLQKGQALSAEQRRELRQRGLVEGRGSRTTVSAGVASATGREAEYVAAKGLDDEHFRALVLKLLAMGPQPRAKINHLLLDKLPASIAGQQRRRDYVKGLLQDMARSGDIENVGGATRAARWALIKR
jgi:ATP-dependent DNA helicase RecG